MATIDDYKYSRYLYNNLLSSVNSVINKLSNYSSNADSEINTIRNSYSVDNDSTDTLNRLVKVKNDVEKTSNYLTNTIVPSIRDKIRYLNRKIIELEASEG